MIIKYDHLTGLQRLNFIINPLGVGSVLYDLFTIFYFQQRQFFYFLFVPFSIVKTLELYKECKNVTPFNMIYNVIFIYILDYF